jgi:hypothetical protein
MRGNFNMLSLFSCSPDASLLGRAAVNPMLPLKAGCPIELTRSNEVQGERNA